MDKVGQRATVLVASLEWEANGVAQDVIHIVSELAYLIRSWRVKESARIL